MTIRVALTHRTEYHFDRSVALAPHVVRLRPAPHTRTPVLSYSLKVEPKQHFINWQQDPFGNFLARLVFPDKTERLVLDVGLVAEMTVINPFDFFLEDSARNYPFTYEPQLARDLSPYLAIAERGPRLTEWVASLDRRERATVDFLVDLNRRVTQQVGYTVRMEPGVKSCEQTLEGGTGSCRDSGWLLVQVLRQLGLAARFVSGYLVQLVPDVKGPEGAAGPSHDFTDLHAWAEVYLPGAGWAGLDATSGLFAGEGHIPLACTPDPASAAPVTGRSDMAKVEFRFENKVERLHEDPRVTRPYSDAQWAAMDALGEQVDRELVAADVRLTMGGEPTFLARDPRDAPEWHIEALGETKRRLAGELLLKLAGRYAQHPLLHYGQGKWYPAEPLPRWALSCFWRTDGEPLWRNPKLQAGDRPASGHGGAEAGRLIQAIARRLGLPASRVIPAHEDPWHHLGEEAKFPANVDPLRSDLKDPEERKRLARLLDGGLNPVAAYVLPLRRNPVAEAPARWQTCAWPLRRERLYLVPGDSAAGLRLPLSSLPFVPPEQLDPELPSDPFAPRAPLPAPEPAVPERPTPASVSTDAEKPMRTALCVEPRDGRIHVFLPPLTHLEHFVELLAAVEDSADETGTPVVITGYEPPRDPRVKLLQVTPDPGVIEVNLHPAASWREQVETTTFLYDAAQELGLCAEKFMLDGRHTGSGGGNHVTLGGAEAADSPFLRRPALLASLITYWQHHPSLSYLFSGSFIGPTSQAPRVDEARDANLYELDIAFQQLPAGDTPEPWRVDRALRNLLVDITGNTHRAEFCIDKLYSPDSPAGRRGLVELRAFEMTPHPQMNLLQALLVRALVARFWKQPYRGALVRWGPELHDRFMLPHFVEQDLGRVVDDLEAAGYAFQRSWFAPFLEFRFPRFGNVSTDGVTLELRAALEPWHVLGEEATAGGMARYVDSSVERLQVKVTGLVPGRHGVACNGRWLPLRPAGVRGHYVAGVRYKAWQPPSGLHPAIPVHTPLIFDVVDLGARRAIGGCTYHVSHPGGRNYDAFPVNANEAEARRMARFHPYGHTPGPLSPPAELPDPDSPCTLDLRRRPVS